MEETPELQKTAKQGIKFTVVGVSGIAVNFTVLTVALYGLHLIYEIAIAVAILCSMSSNYTLNRIWTFESQESVRPEYIRYITLNLVGSLIQYTVALSLTRYFYSHEFMVLNLLIVHLPTIYIASTMGIGLGFISNFLFSKYLVFKS